MRLNIGRLVKIKYQQWFSIFIENFESNWFIDNIYNIFFIDDFEDWGVGDFFTIFTEPFNQSQWFIENLFNNILTDNFEEWFIQNNYNLKFNENFENGGW